MNDELQGVQLQKRQPIFNVPGIILFLLVAMIFVHLVREYILSNSENLTVLVNFAFIPARYGALDKLTLGGPAGIWSPVTYSLMHGDWTHLIVNSIWLLAFGAVVARRFGKIRFIFFCVLASVFGAFAHFIFYSGSLVPMIGASAVVSGCMGAAVRFAFPSGGSFSPQIHDLPPQRLIKAFQNRQVLAFTAVWFAINLLFGLGGELVAGQGQSIAWQAHIGGFLCGLLLFRFFEGKRYYT